MNIKCVLFSRAMFWSLLGTEFMEESLSCTAQWRAQDFFSGGGGGVQQIQLRTEDRENGDLEASAP
jgi:hypothetical protein